MSKALATKKVAAALLGFGMVLAFAGAASAQTTTTTTTTNASTLSTLQAQVQALLAQIAALQGTGTATTGSGACFTFTQDEWQGLSGGQVMWVQEFLNGHGFTVAASGAGSPGNESSYFGALTKAAVMKFQAAEGITPVAGYWGPLSRAKANAICAGSTTTTTTTTGTTGGAGITVTAGTQPANSLAPQLANRVPFTTFTLTNNSGAAVTINGIDVQRTGLAADAAFAGVELIDPNGIQIGTSRTFNSNHQVEVGTPFTLNAGQSETFTIAGNMAANETAYAGQVASLSVTGVDTTVPVSGTLPITGAQQTINASLTIGAATVQRSSFDPLNGRSEAIGTTGLIFSGIRITAGSAENEKLYSITWNQTGSVGSGDLGNLVTVVNGTSYPVTVDSTGKYYTTTFPGGITINEGNSVDAYVQGNLIGSDASGRTIEFDIYRQTDIYLVGQTYGYGITPTPSSAPSNTTPQSGTTNGIPNWTSQFLGSGVGTSYVAAQPFFQGAGIEVTAGTLSTVGNAGSVGAQNIAINVPNQPLGGFSTNFTGEPVTVQSLTFHVASSTAGIQLQNVSLVDSNGNVVAGPVNETDSAATIVFNSAITFPVGPMTYTLKGTVASSQDTTNTQTSTFGAITYTLSTSPSSDWSSPQGETSGSTVSFSGYGTITMSTMTVQAGSLAVSAASTPASTTVAPGANNFVIANINLDASQSGEDIRLSSIPLVIDATSTGAATALKADLTNCQLWNGNTALNSQAVGSNQWTAATLTSNSGAGAVSTVGNSANFIFTNAITIPKGTVTTLSLECNVSSSLSGTSFAAGVDSLIDTSTALVPTGAQSGNSITASVSGNSVSGTMTTGTASLTATVPTALSFADVAGGSTGVTVGTFTLQPTSDSVNLQNIGLALNSNNASSSDIARAYIYNGSTQVGSVTFTGSPVSFNSGKYYLATSTISNLSLPQNQQTVLTIKADINAIGPSSAATDGHKVVISLADAQGVGASSGTSVHSGLGTGTQTGVNIYRTYPTVAAGGSSSGTLLTGTQTLEQFSVTANAGGSVGLQQLGISVGTSTGSASNGTTTVTALTVYAYTDSGYSVAAPGTSNGGQVGTLASLANSGTNIVGFTGAGTPVEIPAGTTYYFKVTGTVTQVAGSSATHGTVQTYLVGDAVNLAPSMFAVSSLGSDNFVWSPNATTTTVVSVTDWTNGYGISGLPSSGITPSTTLSN